MKITKLILMKGVQLEENTSGSKTVYIAGLTKRIKMDTTDMEYKILRGMKHLIGFTKANELAQGNFICYYYTNKSIILKPVKEQNITIYYNLDYDPNNMYTIDNQGNTEKIKMTREYKKMTMKIMGELGKRLKLKEVI